jgi:hypothetical protein
MKAPPTPDANGFHPLPFLGPSPRHAPPLHESRSGLKSWLVHGGSRGGGCHRGWGWMGALSTNSG